MRSKPTIPRELANRDVEEAITHYLGVDVEQAALGFIDSLEQAFAHISRHPASGSPRYAHELILPGLRICRWRATYNWSFIPSTSIKSTCGVCCMASAISQPGCNNPTSFDALIPMGVLW